mmetsp:Transcript_8255/g.27161  ORF Transcript_8255/g.27161 Transcript_8255/m.27161 type:complete len:295 (-) Transcript_8255:863-1747(-)
MRRVRRGRRRRLPRARVHDRRRRRDRPRGLLRQHLRHHRLHRPPGLQEDGGARHVFRRVRLPHELPRLLRPHGDGLPDDRARVDPPHCPLRRPHDVLPDARGRPVALLPGHRPRADAGHLRLHPRHVLFRRPDGHHLPRQGRAVQLARPLLHLHRHHRPQLHLRVYLGLHRRLPLHGRRHALAGDRGPGEEEPPGLALRRGLLPAPAPVHCALLLPTEGPRRADHSRRLQQDPDRRRQADGRQLRRACKGRKGRALIDRIDPPVQYIYLPTSLMTTTPTPPQCEAIRIPRRAAE